MCTGSRIAERLSSPRQQSQRPLRGVSEVFSRLLILRAVLVACAASRGNMVACSFPLPRGRLARDFKIDD